jgi:LL-diaminopimelate aminotransferase
MDFFENKIAERLGGKNFGKSTAIYKFQMIKEAKAAARKAHPDIPLIDMGVGEPDWPADPSVASVLASEAGKPENRWYSDNGIEEFQQAASRYLDQVYGVRGIAPEDIVHGIGSKPVLAILPLCFMNPGDVVLMTVPGYPVTGTYSRYLGAEVFPLPLREENGFLPDLASIPADVLKRAKMLYLNYPNNPTGAVATEAFFRLVVEFAKTNDILVVHDAAYAALVYDGRKPLSFLSVDGARDVGLEIHSLSKAFNMTGWRLGFVAGNPKAVKAYATVKDNTDSGQFRAIQKAGAYALAHPEITARTIEKYSRRFDLLAAALQKAGFDAKKPGGSFYFYVRCPKYAADGTVFDTASRFSEYAITKALISTVPWDDAGAYVRFSVTFEASSQDEERNVIEEAGRRLAGLGLRF